MPCGCFGGNKKNKGKVKVPPSPPLDQSTPTTQVRGGQDDPNKTAKRRDVVASHYGDECALLGYKPTGSRPPSSYVDSPNSHTPSTAPLDASSRESSVGSSSPETRRANRLQGALCRAQLAEKRREFFRDFATPDYRSSPYALSSTLPSRPRPILGKPLRSAASRPLSQPCEDGTQPPPGPHLLHPSPNDERPPKIDSESLASKEFLDELKMASDEISRRWAMTEEEKGDYRCTLKMKTRPHFLENIDGDEQEDQIRLCASDSESEHSKSAPVPETVVTPPSPQVIDFVTNQDHDDEHQEVKNDKFSTSLEETYNSSTVVQSSSDQQHPNQSFNSSSSSERVVCISEPEVSSEVLDDISNDFKTNSEEKYEASLMEESKLDSRLDEEKQEEFEAIISPLEDEEDDYPTNYELDKKSQSEMMQLLEEEETMEDVDIEEQDDERFEHSTVISNPFVQYNDQEEVISPLDSRLQLISEENLLEVQEAEEEGQASSLSSEEDPNLMSVEPTYEQSANVKNEQYIHENNDNFDIKMEQEETRTMEPHDANLNFVEATSLLKEELGDFNSNELLSPSTPSTTTTPTTALDQPKIDSSDVIHDDGLGSEIEEGSDFIDDQNQAAKVQQTSSSSINNSKTT